VLKEAYGRICPFSVFPPGHGSPIARFPFSLPSPASTTPFKRTERPWVLFWFRGWSEPFNRSYVLFTPPARRRHPRTFFPSPKPTIIPSILWNSGTPFLLFSVPLLFCRPGFSRQVSTERSSRDESHTRQDVFLMYHSVFPCSSLFLGPRPPLKDAC